MTDKQAVLLIHGIGDQKPLETLRNFVIAAWSRNKRVHGKFSGDGIWSKPDSVSESYELRKYSTVRNKCGVTTDFYELYWQHLMQGTTYSHVLAWAKTLLWRRPSTVPPQLKPVYWLLISVLLVSVGLLAYTAIKFGDINKLIPTWLSLLMSLLILPFLGFVVKNVVGDAARYLHPAPDNVQSRHAIRHAGVCVLKTLHERGYSRIVVVGHSLGSVIGYDALTHAWVNFHGKEPAETATMDALDAIEKMARESPVPGIAKVQEAQHRYFAELKANGNQWRVTDFVTLGSPLAHADMLLARDGPDFLQRCKDRELPTCPPQLESGTRDKETVQVFSFLPKDAIRRPNHAALFAATRWTNLFFPCHAIFYGDVVGGPVTRLFGGWVNDVRVSTRIRFGLLSHTHYWSFPKPKKKHDDQMEELPAHINELCRALDIAADGYPDDAAQPPAEKAMPAAAA